MESLEGFMSDYSNARHTDPQAKLDAPAWGQAAEAMSTIVAEANQFQKLNGECDAGDSAACDTLSKEDEAKAAWLAKIDVPSWGAAAAAMKQIGEEQLAETMANESEEEAKKKWLAKLCASPRLALITNLPFTTLLTSH